MATASVLYVTKDWLVALGVRVGIAQYNARVHSRLIVQDIALDLLTLTATARGVSIAERGQTPLEAPIYVKQATAKVRLWPLIRRQIVLDEVAVSGVTVRLEVDRQNRVNLEEFFRLVSDDPDKPSPWNVIIHHFTVDQALVNLAFEGQPVQASLDQMAFQGSLTVQPLHVHAEMLSGQGDVTYLFRQDRLRYHLAQTTAMVDVFKKRLIIDQMRVGATEFTVTGRGGIDNAQVAGQFTIDLALATVAAFIPDIPPPVGSSTVHGTIDGPLGNPRVRLAAEGAHVGVGPYAAANLSADINLAGKRLHLERFVFGLAGGTVRGIGTLDLASEHLDVQVDVAELSLAGLEPLAAGAAALVNGHVGGRVRLVSPSFSPASIRVEGTLALSPLESPQKVARAAILPPAAGTEHQVLFQQSHPHPRAGGVDSRRGTGPAHGDAGARWDHAAFGGCGRGPYRPDIRRHGAHVRAWRSARHLRSARESARTTREGRFPTAPGKLPKHPYRVSPAGVRSRPLDGENHLPRRCSMGGALSGYGYDRAVYSIQPPARQCRGVADPGYFWVASARRAHEPCRPHSAAPRRRALGGQVHPPSQWRRTMDQPAWRRAD
ncbi:MAG: AsmA family protein [Candidatus Entotheonellia bacterium]